MQCSGVDSTSSSHGSSYGASPLSLCSPAGRRPAAIFGYAYPSMPDYYVEDWDVEDIYPYRRLGSCRRQYQGVRLWWLSPVSAAFTSPCRSMMAGSSIPLSCRCMPRLFIERVIFFDRHYLRDCRLRQRELNNLIYLAQATGNRNLLLDARRELDYLNVRTNWASRRIHRLESRVAALQGDQRKFAGKLPRGLNLHDAISNSFNSPRNLPVVQKLQDRVKTELAVQNQLANVAGQEVASA